jgi:hypothetical protein
MTFLCTKIEVIIIRLQNLRQLYLTKVYCTISGVGLPTFRKHLQFSSVEQLFVVAATDSGLYFYVRFEVFTAVTMKNAVF